MTVLLPLLAGTLFGAGLAVSGMIDPRKILAFLDVAGIPDGSWDPTLGVVFAAALAPMFVAYAIQRRMRKPVFEASFHIPTRREIDARLVTGAAVFGVGWGLSGLCPGPALAMLPAVGSQLPGLVLFIAAMLAGLWASTRLRDRAEKTSPEARPVPAP